uniref:EamA domain-containing protein n=1 Tax=Amphimedon queenslandica TaxID=400682 RepID=A0A1X7V2X9_AMPQE
MKILYYFLVALVWGCTDPLLKRGSHGMDSVVTSSNRILSILLQLKWLLLNYQFTLPFIINQTGSILYYIVVAQSDISVAVPIINSLKLVVTALVGWLVLGERVQSISTYCGMLCIVIGVSLSVISK